MALNSINTNIAAYAAQGNIGKASASASSSIARLSSGNRIVKSSDDVAALSAGTSLRTSVTTLKTALVNAAQGSSLLQVADGALSQVVDILQRQKAIAIQAGSGSLSNTERSFLNQEFQALSQEIDRLSSNTKFNKVSLLDGSLAGAVKVTSNINDGTSTAGTTAGMVTTIGAGNAANNDQITINGVTITFSSSAVGTTAAAGKVSIGASVTDTAANLVAFLNSSTDARFANLVFTNAAGVVSANWGGGALDGSYVVSASVITGANITVGTAVNRTIATTNPGDGLSVDKVHALGTVTGSLLATANTTAVAAGAPIQTRAIEDNQYFIGKLGEGRMGFITGTYLATDSASFSLKVGDLTYTTAATTITGGAAPIALTFIGSDNTGAAKGGQFVLNLTGTAITATTITGQSKLDPIVTQLNDALSGITFTQNRDVTSFQEGQIVTVGGVQVGNLNGASVNFRSGDFSNLKVESVKITAPGIGSTDAIFEVVINGETYRSASGIGNQIATNTSITLQSATNPTNALTIQLGNTAIVTASGIALDLSTQSNADAVGAALQTAFGLDDSTATLSFQVGASSDDSLGVKIDSVGTTSLYGGQTVDVLTQANASAASTILDNALNTVISIRANVGALQSRFDFTSATLQTSLQNQDAARGTLLDTDVAAESTAYATSQVQLQAGIAVLAQANQLPQNLLKLIA